MFLKKYNVIFKLYNPGIFKLYMIKTLLILSENSIGLKEAKNYIDTCPHTFRFNISKEVIDKAREYLNGTKNARYEFTDIEVIRNEKIKNLLTDYPLI